MQLVTTTTDNQPAFPVALSAKDRNSFGTKKLSWKSWKKEKGIKDSMSLDKIKESQNEYKAHKAVVLEQSRIMNAALLAQAGFDNMQTQLWEDKKGYKNIAIRLSNRPLDKSKVAVRDADEMSIEELEKLVADKKAVSNSIATAACSW